MAQDYYDVLTYNDQLYLEMQLGNIPKWLKEGKIEFAPTFKRKPNDNYSYNTKRNPSWTDRILHYHNFKVCTLTLKSYDCNNTVNLSDHRPVFA
jgi:hypothetical protein